MGLAVKAPHNIAIVASDLMGSPGGATSVTVWMIEALAKVHRVTLFATGATVDFDHLNALYGTQISTQDVHLCQPSQNFGASIPGARRTRQLRIALLARKLRRAPEYDLYISATNEIVLPHPHLQYIHFPQHNMQALRMQASGWRLAPRLVNEALYRAASGFRSRFLTHTRLLTNSKWTGRFISETYGVEAEVVYPPVALPAERGLPWPARELSIITVGRFDAKKNFHEAVYLTDRIRQSVPDAKLYIVGLGSGPYREFLLDLASKRTAYVKVLEGLPRQELAALMGRCKFAIHCAHGEHFGMAPAEMAASGCVTFVHASGGQVETVDHNPQLTFSDQDDAYRKFISLATNPLRAAELSQSCSDFAYKQFSSDVFQSRICAIADELMQVEPVHSGKSFSTLSVAAS